MDEVLKNYYIEFNSLKSIQEKIDYLYKNREDIEKDFEINIQNLIAYWKKKL